MLFFMAEWGPHLAQNAKEVDVEGHSSQMGSGFYSSSWLTIQKMHFSLDLSLVLKKKIFCSLCYGLQKPSWGFYFHHRHLKSKLLFLTKISLYWEDCQGMFSFACLSAEAPSVCPKLRIHISNPKLPSLAIRGGARVRRAGIAGWTAKDFPSEEHCLSQCLLWERWRALLSQVPVLIFCPILGHFESWKSIPLEVFISHVCLIAIPWLQ